MVGDSGPSASDELTAIERRLSALELRLASLETPRSATTRCPRCANDVPAGRFCTACGAILADVARAPSPPPASPVAARPLISTPVSRPAPAIAAPHAPAPREPAPAINLESALGQRWAPRLGAMLVFLGIVFFLGVAIQRGWIGPLMQLTLAVATGAALLAVGALLTHRRGYGTYPQILEATGACVLYVTAFIAHALPYYERATGLTSMGSGLLMATIAAGTVALALWRDARVIAGLGYSLAFVTAILGTSTLPGLTLAYVAILGTSLALLVARKGWLLEALLGTLSTGALLLGLAYLGEPDPRVVALVGLAPAAAFLWLATRATPAEDDGALSALLALSTLAWATLASVLAADTQPAIGLVLLTWALVAAAHTALAARANAGRLTRAASGSAAILLWILGAPLAWAEWSEPQILVTATYTLPALLLGYLATQRAAARNLWNGALVLVGAAALHAIGTGAIHPPWQASARILGPWQTWATLLLIATPLAQAATAQEIPSAARRAAFWIAAAFGALWTFALFSAPLPATMWLLLVAAALLAIALRANEQENGIGASALAATLCVIGLVAIKISFLDARVRATKLEPATAALQALAVAGAMLALYHIARERGLLRNDLDRPTSAALIGGSALVLTNWLLVYTQSPWTSILLGATGVAYLTTGLLRRTHTLYRYTGFAILGLVLLRVFTIEMQGTDLAIRALVFAVLGAILLGIGYAYARISKREQHPETP